MRGWTLWPIQRVRTSRAGLEWTESALPALLRRLQGTCTVCIYLLLTALRAQAVHAWIYLSTESTLNHVCKSVCPCVVRPLVSWERPEVRTRLIGWHTRWYQFYILSIFALFLPQFSQGDWFGWSQSVWVSVEHKRYELDSKGDWKFGPLGLIYSKTCQRFSSNCRIRVICLISLDRVSGIFWAIATRVC